MSKKESIYTVIGGIVGAVLVTAAGLIAPLVAQNSLDGTFEKITCERLEVSTVSGTVEIGFEGIKMVDSDGQNRAWLMSVGDKTIFWMCDMEGKSRVTIGVNEHGGRVAVNDKDEQSRVKTFVNEHGGRVETNGKNLESGASMGMYEHGGGVAVFGKGGDRTEARAVMAVNAYGNGGVSTWDKNGYRLATLR